MVPSRLFLPSATGDPERLQPLCRTIVDDLAETTHACTARSMPDTFGDNPGSKGNTTPKRYTQAIHPSENSEMVGGPLATVHRLVLTAVVRFRWDQTILDGSGMGLRL